MPTPIVKLADASGEFVMDVDGYWHYAPKGAGLIPAYALRQLAQEMDDRNAVWDEQVRLAGRTTINPMWIEGLQLIDKMIIALVDAGWEIIGGDDGGEKMERFTTRKAAIELVASVDQSQLFFKRGGRNSVVTLIPGNGAADAICDNSTGDPEFNALLNKVAGLDVPAVGAL